jgi:hypothetical protein
MENETPFGMGKTGRVDVITRIGAAVGGTGNGNKDGT